MITVSKEDYLKAVSEAEAETVISATLARWLSVTRPAVTAALKRLRKGGMVIVKNDGRIDLTPTGHKVAERTIFRHHLIERMLSEMFGMVWTKSTAKMSALSMPSLPVLRRSSSRSSATRTLALTGTVFP